MWVMVMVLFLLVIFVQTIFSYLQLRNIYTKIAGLKSKYKNEYYLVTGTSKRKLSFGKGFLIVTVIDDNDNIIEFLEMSGYTVFSRLKNKDDYTNLSLDSLHEKVSNKKLKLALENAKELLQNKKLECLEQQ